MGLMGIGTLGNVLRKKKFRFGFFLQKGVDLPIRSDRVIQPLQKHETVKRLSFP